MEIGVQKDTDQLEKESFEILLQRLNPNPNIAENRYLVIRSKLITFFRTRGYCEVDLELADKTIDRAARKLAQVKVAPLDEMDLAERELPTPDENNLTDSYFLAIARFILKEHQRKLSPTIALEEIPPPKQPISTYKTDIEQLEQEEDKELILKYFNKCLDGFSVDKRLLLIEYFSLEKSKSDNRKSLADKLNISVNALRVKTHRLRTDVTDCVKECIKNSGKVKNIL